MWPLGKQILWSCCIPSVLQLCFPGNGRGVSQVSIDCCTKLLCERCVSSTTNCTNPDPPLLCARRLNYRMPFHCSVQPGVPKASWPFAALAECCHLLRYAGRANSNRLRPPIKEGSENVLSEVQLINYAALIAPSPYPYLTDITVPDSYVAIRRTEHERRFFSS